MIYPDIRVDIPDMGGYINSRGDVQYLYVYIGDRQVVDGTGKTKRPKSKCIGRVESDENNNPVLMPNTQYYELMGLPQPSLAVIEGTGRKPWHQKPEPIQSRALDSEITMGYGLVVSLLSEELGLTGVLEEAFGAERGRKILSLAAFMCERAHSSMGGLDAFIGNHLAGTSFDLKFDRRAAGQLLVELTPVRCGVFYKLWNAKHPAGRNIFYDVTSFSTYSGQIMRAHYGYNRDHDDLPQINQGLFCDQESGLPLFMCAYDGSLNDKRNFDFALSRAKEHGLKARHRHLTIITDGGFSSENLSFTHLQGYDFIVGVSADYLSKVKDAYVEWSKSITENDRNNSWPCGDGTYISSSKSFSIGGVDGTLMMYRDLSIESDKRAQLTRKIDECRQVLESTDKAPKEGFESWAKSFKPFYNVTKHAGRKGFVFERNNDEISKAFALCGKVTLFVQQSCGNISPRKALCEYRSKESVEDCFDTTKNGLSDKRLHIKGDRQVDGKLFVMFVALILRRSIHRRLSSYLEEKGYSDEDAIRELEGIRFYKAKDGWRLKDAVTKTQREIMQALNLKLTDNTELKQSLFKQRQRKGRKSKITDAPLHKVLERTVR